MTPKPTERLNRLVIGSSCHAAWDDMQIEGGRRFCSSCNRYVHDFAAMTPDQIEARIADSGGRLCARITRDPEGNLITRLPPVPDLGSRRVSPLAASVVTALLGLGGAGAAVALPSAPPALLAPAVPADSLPNAKSPATGAIRGTVADKQGRYPGFDLKLRLPDGSERTTVSAADGSFAFDGLAAGTYQLEARLEGFADTFEPEIVLQAGETVDARIVPQMLEFEAEMGVVITEQPFRLLFAESPLVVLATVGRSATVDTSFQSVSTELLLDSRSILKGKAPGPSLQVVHYSGGQEIASGSRVLALLQPRTGTGGPGTSPSFALSGFQGLHALSDAEVEAYRERLTALERLQSSKSLSDVGAAEVEWLVATAEEPLTRFVGTGDLLRTPVQKLSGEQRERLSRALLRSPGLTGGDIGLYRVVESWDKEAALAWLSRQLLTLEPVADGTGFEAMQILAYERHDAALDTLLKQAGVADRKAQALLPPDPTPEERRRYQESYAAIQKELRRQFRLALAQLGPSRSR